ncbi:MAG: hypothetical protein HFE90_07590 [Firmicutes bacterium]|nr:hypothetical protein [Bacillota bacterium]
MKIEIMYHDDAMKHLKEISENIEEYCPEDAADLDNDIRDILVNEKCRRLKRVLSKSKLKRFKQLAQNALWAAYCVDSNIIVETKNNFLGKIIFESDWMWISNSWNHRVKIIMNELLMAANEIIISTFSDLYRIEFWYKLYDDPAE